VREGSDDKRGLEEGIYRRGEAVPGLPGKPRWRAAIDGEWRSVARPLGVGRDGGDPELRRGRSGGCGLGHASWAAP
jgi:hypothetical protein